MEAATRYEKFFSHPRYSNCGVTLRSRKESRQVIKERLEQLKLEGKGESFLARVYKRILERD